MQRTMADEEVSEVSREENSACCCIIGTSDPFKKCEISKSKCCHSFEFTPSC